MSDDTTRAPNEESTITRDESRKMARRYFVKAMVYAAPAVAGVVAVQHASAQTSYCATECVFPSCNGGSQCTLQGCTGGC